MLEPARCTPMPIMSNPPKEFSPDLPPLDEADHKLIGLLCEDGRMSGRDMAQRSGLSEANVSRRLARLVEEGSVRIVAMVPAELLGQHMRTILLLRCKGEPTESAERLARLASVHWCGATFGEFDIVVYAVLRDAHHLIDFVDQIFAGDPNLENLVMCPVLDYYAPKDPGEALDGVTSARHRGRRGKPLAEALDTTDRLLIRALQANGRASFAELAEASGISATSAADRFRRLVSDGVVTILTLPSPARIGNMVRVTACLTVKGPIRKVLEQAASIPGSLWPCATAGPFGVVMDFACPDEAAMNRMRARLMDIPGVSAVGLSLHRKVLRDDVQWGDDEPQPTTQS
jgi:DNA-binding Lrp family transcriptional regulator